MREGISGTPEGESESAAAGEHPAPDHQPPYHVSAGDDVVIVAEVAAAADVEADHDEDEDVEAAGAKGDLGDARKRRRRGRRGGRRNRREEGDFGISLPENGVVPIDEEVAHAVADFGGPPADVVARETTSRETTWHREAREPEPVHVEHAGAVSEPAMASEPAAVPTKPESPRRRSTVREPAPFLVTGASISPAVTPTPERAAEIAASSEPAESAPAQEGAEPAPQPRRAGWWAKRMLGDKG
jgi:ribonuclease E